MKHGCPFTPHMLDETFSPSRPGLAIDFDFAARWITLRTEAKKWERKEDSRLGKNRIPPMSLSVSPLKWNSIKLVYFFDCWGGGIFKATLKNRLGAVQLRNVPDCCCCVHQKSGSVKVIQCCWPKKIIEQILSLGHICCSRDFEVKLSNSIVILCLL